MIFELSMFRGVTHLKLDTSQDGPGLNLIFGNVQNSAIADSNGAGKTTIALGMYWTAYGDTFLKIPLKELINNKAKRGAAAVGRLQFDLPNKGTIAIERKQSKSKHTVTATINDVPVAGDVDVVNAAILDFMGMNAKQFQSLMMFTGEFLFAAQTDASMKTVLGSLIPIDVTAALTHVNKEHKTASEQILRIKTGLENAKSTIGARREAVEREEEALANWELSQQNRIAQDQQALESAYAAVQEAEKHIADWEATGVEQQEELRAKANSLKAQMANLDRELERLGGDYDRYNLQATVSFSESSCASCGQALPQDKIEIMLQQHEEQTAMAAVRRDEVWAHITAKREERAATETEWTELETKLAQAQHLDISQLHQWRAVLRDRQAAHTNADRQLGITRAATNPHVNTLKVHQENLEAAEQSIKDYEDGLPVFEQGLKFWDWMQKMAGKTGLAQHSMGQLLPMLSASASEYLSMVAGDEMTAVFRSETGKGKPKFHIECARANGGDSYGQISSGEQRRIDAAVFLAVNAFASAALCDFPVIFVDELLDHSTDSSAKAAMLPMLHHYAMQKGKQVFVISNDRSIANDRRLFNRVLHVTKTDVGSSVEDLK